MGRGEGSSSIESAAAVAAAVAGGLQGAWLPLFLGDRTVSYARATLFYQTPGIAYSTAFPNPI